MRILAALAAFFLVACEEPTGPSEAAPVSAAEEMESILDLPDGGMIGLSPELASRFAPEGDEVSWNVHMDPMELPGAQDSVDYEEGDPLLMANSVWYCEYFGGGWWRCIRLEQ